MTRESPYAASHKGLRNALGRFQLLAGATRYDDPAEVAVLQARGRSLARLLHHHLVAEERFFLAPLRARDAAAADVDLAAHEGMEAEQRRMMDALAALDGRGTAEDGRAFYLQVTGFHARYLLHILHEEQVTEPALFAAFTEEEVAGFTAAIFQTVEPDVLLMSLRTILPAQTVTERVALLERVRDAPFFSDLRAGLTEDLGEAEAARLLA